MSRYDLARSACTGTGLLRVPVVRGAALDALRGGDVLRGQLRRRATGKGRTGFGMARFAGHPNRGFVTGRRPWVRACLSHRRPPTSPNSGR
jgi:hypothetical protein